MDSNKKIDEKKYPYSMVSKALFSEANDSLSKFLASIKPIIPHIQSLIPIETFSQFEKIASSITI